MKQQFLGRKLQCSNCGTIYLDIPEDATESTIVTCSKCTLRLGTWGELQDEYFRQAGSGVFEIRSGRFKRR